MGAHLAQRRQEPGPERVHHHPFDDDVRTRNDQRGDDRERGRGGIGGNDDGRGPQLRPAGERDPPPFALGRDADLGAEIAQASSRYGRARPRASITVVAPRALRPARRTADLICAEATGVRYSIGPGSRAPLSTIGQRPPSASDRTCAPISRERIEDAPHRPLAERGVAVEGRGDSVAADDAHHQPRAGAGVAEIEGFARRQDRAEPGPRIRHWPGPSALDDRAERPASLAGPQHVVAFEQPLDPGFATGEEAKQEGAMRDRLVARRPDPALERARARGAEGRSRAGCDE